MLNKKAFTLVELIVVITILAILGTIAFISLQGYSKDARDSKRIADLKTIEKGISLEILKNEKIFLPEEYIEVTASGELIGFQGYADKNFLGKIGVNYVKDPIDGLDYTIMFNKKIDKFQLLGYMESKETSFNFIGNMTNAFDFSKRYPKTLGSSLGVLISSGSNLPAQELGNNIDVINTSENLIAKINNSIEYSGKDINKVYITLNYNGFILNDDGFVIFESKGDWDYSNEENECLNVIFFDDNKLKEMEKLFKLGMKNIKVESDIELRYDGDDSNPMHFLYGKKIIDFTNYNLHLNIPARNHTHLSFEDGYLDRLKCTGSTTTHVCGTNGLPEKDSYSEPLIIYNIKMQPNCNGSSTVFSDGEYQWYRNKYTFRGSYYNVLIK